MKPKADMNSIGSKRKFEFNNTMGILVVIVVFSIVLSFISKNFLTVDNMVVLARNSSITIMVGLAQMVVMSGGGMNVSVGAIGSVSAVLCGAFMQRLGIPWPIAILIAICGGAICGALNGLFITGLGGTGEISWLTTLATSSAFTGVSLGITHAKPFYNLPAGYNWIGSYNIGGFLPLMIVICLVFTILVGILFKYTSLGRQILALGGNSKAAALSGIPIKKIIIIKHIISAVIAASAGILFSTRLGSINPDIGGDWMLFSFAAPLIGGTRMEGGRVNVVGAFLGGLLLSMVSNGVVHMRVNVYLVEFIEGLIILIAVGMDRIRAIREEKRERLERSAI